MKPQRSVIVAGCVVVVLFDLAAALAARRFEFPYVRASIGSCFIYLLIGFALGRRTLARSGRTGALGAAVAGLVDVSIGWAISWAIGPGRSPSGTLSVTEWVVTAVVVVAFAAVVGYVGGVLGARSRPVASVAD